MAAFSAARSRAPAHTAADEDVDSPRSNGPRSAGPLLMLKR